MRVSGTVAAGAVLDEDALHALAGNVREGMLVNQRHLRVPRIICKSRLGDVMSGSCGQRDRKG
ncbi:hypothetical protein D3C87_1939670 [compost metagenome]